MDNHAVTAETPLLSRAPVPTLFTRRGLAELSEKPTLPSRTAFPHPKFEYARKDGSGRIMPQAIAHRGYKAKYPENTMGAFEGAVEVGAQAIETDIHLSKDGVVVLSHDATLKRCFGKPGKVIDYDWEYLSTLETLKEPRQKMPRLQDLLEYLTKPGLEDIWVLLDIKLDNNACDVMRLIAETIRRVPPVESRPWEGRIVLGVWAMKYLPLCDQYLPHFPISLICFSTLYASPLFAVPNVGFNMYQPVLMTPWGLRFLRTAQRLRRPVLAWTVNDEKRMRWGIRKQLDGVITDDPKKFVEIRDGWKDGTEDELGVKDWLDVWRVNIFALLFSLLFFWRLRPGLEKRFERREVVEE